MLQLTSARHPPPHSLPYTSASHASHSGPAKPPSQLVGGGEEVLGTGVVVLELLLDAVGAGVLELLLEDVSTGVVLDVLDAALVLLLVEDGIALVLEDEDVGTGVVLGAAFVVLLDEDVGASVVPYAGSYMITGSLSISALDMFWFWSSALSLSMVMAAVIGGVLCPMRLAGTSIAISTAMPVPAASNLRLLSGPCTDRIRTRLTPMSAVSATAWRSPSRLTSSNSSTV